MAQSHSTSYTLGMTKIEVINFFGSLSATARALNIKQPSVSKWNDYPPANRQMQVQIISGGKLKAEPWVMDELLGTKTKEVR